MIFNRTTLQFDIIPSFKLKWKYISFDRLHHNTNRIPGPPAQDDKQIHAFQSKKYIIKKITSSYQTRRLSATDCRSKLCKHRKAFNAAEQALIIKVSL